MSRQSTKDFEGSENIREGTIMMDTYHYKLVQTHRVYNTEGEL